MTTDLLLGWNLRKYNGKLLTQPSQKSIEKIIDKMREIIHEAAAWTQEDLIHALNPIIMGWANYHRHIVANRAYQRLDFILEYALEVGQTQTPEKGHRWIARRYWHTEGTRNWSSKQICKTRSVLRYEDSQIYHGKT